LKNGRKIIATTPTMNIRDKCNGNIIVGKLWANTDCGNFTFITEKKNSS
jgi:hypothetical protein